MISRSDIRNALARGYCDEHNHAKPIDVELIEAMVDEVMAAISTELQRNEFYRAVSAAHIDPPSNLSQANSLADADKEGRRR